MHLKSSESNGPAASQSPTKDKSYKKFEQHSSNLPFGQHVALSELSGSTYSTLQTLVQQVTFLLSDRIWTYSPESLDIDVAVKSWYNGGERNVHGYSPNVEAMEIRSGAATIALGYIFSKDFDLKKRHTPQAILATSSSLQFLRAALDQLSLLYSVASPFVAHIAAVDYQVSGNTGYITDYTSALTLADEIGLGVVSSSSIHEAQHMALLSTLFASILPTLHIYDGVRVGRDTTKLSAILDQHKLKAHYHNILEAAGKSAKKYDSKEAKVTRLLSCLNKELGTDYSPFEYHGHENAGHVFIVFGTIEASLGRQLIAGLAEKDQKIGLVNVRVYRPFAEEEFLNVLPKTAKTISTLGQVEDVAAASDAAVQSALYKDVLATLTFAENWKSMPKVVDIKYAREQIWTRDSLLAVFQKATPKLPLDIDQEFSQDQVEKREYIFWNLDDTPASKATAALAKALSKDSSSNVSFSVKHDNLVGGGIQRTDIQKSKNSFDTASAIKKADTVWAGSLDIIKSIDIINSTKPKGSLILNCPGIKDDELEKKLPASFRKGVHSQNLKLYILNPNEIKDVGDEEEILIYLSQIAFLRAAMPGQEMTGLWKLSGINGNSEILGSLSDKLSQGFRLIEIPEEWAKIDEAESQQPVLPTDISTNSFTTFDKSETEVSTIQSSRTSIAKSLVFKEAYGSGTSVRPDLSVPTWTVTLKEHRRLTPETYDRNIMDLEFDLGDSGLQYNIGDSLGIHPCNDTTEVQEFIASYGLNPNDIIQTPIPDSPQLTRSNTIYQILRSQLDIFGRPGRQFYEALSAYATDAEQAKNLLTISQPAGAREFTRRAEVDTITYADILAEFPSARPSFADLIGIIPPLKRREYSIASCQKVRPTSVHLMIVTVLWTDSRKRDRFGLATRYLDALRPGDQVTVSLKPSVMKLPPSPTDAIIMAGLGTGLAPFRAFVQHRAWEKSRGVPIGPVLLYMGSRHQREEYCYGEEWEAYRDAGVISLLSCAFSRDQPHKIYIQDRMRETGRALEKAYFDKDTSGAFYLCGPTWPVPDVTKVIEDVVAEMKVREAREAGKKVDAKKVNARREIEALKDDGRFVLEVY